MKSPVRDLKLIREGLKFFGREEEARIFLICSLITVFLLMVSFSLFILLGFLFFGNSKLLFRLFLMLFFPYYFLISFTVSFFQACIISYVYSYTSNEKQTFSKVLKDNYKHMRKLFVWSTICSTLGLFLELIPKRKPIRVEDKILSRSWSLVGLLVIPVMIFENKTPLKAFKKAAVLLRINWGEVLEGWPSTRLILLIFGVVGIDIFFMSYPFLQTLFHKLLAIIFLVGYASMLRAIFSSINGVFMGVLYSYISKGVTKIYPMELIKTAFERARILE